MGYPRFAGLLIRTEAGSPLALGDSQPQPFRIGETKFELEPLFTAAPALAELGIGEPAKWFLAQTAGSVEGIPGWDAVHQEMRGRARELGMGAGPELFVEPDFEQVFIAFPESKEALAVHGIPGVPDPQDTNLPQGPGFAWHLQETFSQLNEAREVAQGGKLACIAHLDTGYDPAHSTRPQFLLDKFGFDFVDNDRGAEDPGIGGVLKNPGHGTGTLSILAGSRVAQLGDFLGGAPQAKIIPIRIATSVVLFRTSAFARALDYILKPKSDSGEELPPVDVVSLSMGGVASQAWAEAVNRAYESGVFIVAAAGNNVSLGIAGFPTKRIVYPARFRRVLAACGVMANRQPYDGLPFRRLQGNYGPSSKMATALAAYTPNMPWAEWGAADVVDMNGEGTSSATPQIAAAAALWVAAHRSALDAYHAPWMRVEAARHALFSTADKSADGGRTEKLGNGILRAHLALGVRPLNNPVLTPPDSAFLPLLRILTGLGIGADGGTASLALEASQLVQQAPSASEPNPFDDVLLDADLPYESLPPNQVRQFLEKLIAHPRASKALRGRLKEVAQDFFPGPAQVQIPAAAAPATPVKAVKPSERKLCKTDAGRPVHRRLRGFAFDPSLKTQLDTAPISEVTFKVPWEELDPGPVGEYLEVIDYDPTSRCFYCPVDLDEEYVLAQDGLVPSEGTPQFHQQMAYAVAQITIHNFERALGRKAFWAPGPSLDPANPHNDSHFVPRLRIYPHALREANAYYSPAKKALLFGYYRASANDPGGHLPGGTVFTVLSHDVVAHETAHALLDGMHRSYTAPTNPDVRAFHEAFADIVALFQHFTFPDILRHQIATTRGEIRLQENLLGQLASQFGRTTGRRGALRDAIGRVNPDTGRWEPRTPDPHDLERATEPHERGAILVAAVFDAFLSIYEKRTRDLIRLATGGTGVLPLGAIHPDLVQRLAEGAAKAANHVLSMCIRALDYCPPTDLTFGEYLRALITADYDLVRDDDLGYRVAVIEAFRRRGIYPRDVRTLSEESLLWKGPHNSVYRPSRELLAGIARLRPYAEAHIYTESRSDLFYVARNLRRDIHEWLADHFGGGQHPEDALYLGLDPALSFEVHSARLANRIGPDGDMLPQFIIELLQERDVPIDPQAPNGEVMRFRGGCTIVADLRALQIKYCIRKRFSSDSREKRQRQFLAGLADGSLYATYFSGTELTEQGEPFALIHRA